MPWKYKITSLLRDVPRFGHPHPCLPSRLTCSRESMMYVSCLSSNSPFRFRLPKLSKATSGLGNFSPTSLLNKKPEKSQEATGLLSKGIELVPDSVLKLIFFGLSIYLSALRRILRRFIPSFIKNFIVRAGLHRLSLMSSDLWY